jgi:hypothetical protein
MSNDAKDLQTKLAAPFADADIEWRLQWADDDKGTGIAVPYVDNRAIQNRLDACVGVTGWQNTFLPWHEGAGKKAAQLCGISLWSDERGEWIAKYDGADDSDIEPVKGGLSDSMKRAAVQWGVGRYLYGMDTVFVDTEKRGKTTVIKRTERAKLDKAHGDYAAKVFGPAPNGALPEKPAAKPGKAPGGAPKKETPTPGPAAGPPVIEAGVSVLKTALQASAKGGNNTNLLLAFGKDEPVQVYLKGEDPRLVPGVCLTDVKITEKLSKGVKFLILDGYGVAQNAA